MKGLQVLAGPERAELSPCMAQAEGRLPFVHAGAEQLELEDRLQFADRGWRRRSEAQAALAHAGERAVILPELDSANVGSLVTRRVSNQFGLICLKSWPMSSIANP